MTQLPLWGQGWKVVTVERWLSMRGRGGTVHVTEIH